MSWIEALTSEDWAALPLAGVTADFFCNLLNSSGILWIEPVLPETTPVEEGPSVGGDEVERDEGGDHRHYLHRHEGTVLKNWS